MKGLEMKVVNKEIGIPVCVKVNGVKYVIPGDRKAYYLPDEAFEGYKNLFHIVVPPMPKVQKQFIPLEKFTVGISPATEIQPIEPLAVPKKKRKRNGNSNWVKWIYIITSPEGKTVEVGSLVKFCEEMKMNFNVLYNACINNKLWNGWKVSRRSKNKDK